MNTFIMPMYNLIEYSDNYSDTSGSLRQFKRDELPIGVINPNVTTTNSISFKYISSFFKKLTNDDNGVFKNTKTAVPLKYLSIFWRLLQMLLINCKIDLKLNSTKHFVISNILWDVIFNELNQLVRINVKLTKQLKEGLFIGMSIK